MPIIGGKFFLMISEGQILDGKVVRLTSYGAFVKVDGGEIGMVHISEIADGYVKEIKDYLKEDQEVKVMVLAPAKDGKLNLSIKKALSPQRNNKTDSDTRSRTNSFTPNSNDSETKDVSSNFEDRLAKFMKESDEKLLVLKRKNEGKRSGYKRKSS